MTDINRGPGESLRTEREALGVTVREVAETLNLSMTIVQALESDDYERLPGDVFARGYIRAYARLLDLDPQPLLERYPGRVNGTDNHPAQHEHGIAEWVRRRPGLVLSIIGLALAALLAGLALLLWPEDGVDSLWNRTPTPAVVVPPRDAGSDWDWTAPEDAAPPDAPAEVDPLTPGPTGLVVEGVAEEPADPSDGSAARRITETGEQRLEMRFAADSWVEVRNADGRVLYSNLNRSGTALELVGASPFRILLGYAPGVTLTFEGEQIALGPHTRNNVAALVLGQ